MSQNSNPVETQQEQKNSKEYNFDILRKQLEQERVARQQAESRIAEVEKLAQERIKSANSEEDDDDEPYVDRKKLNKTLSSFKKTMDEEVDRRVQEGARRLFEEEKRVSFLRENPDFQQVMSSDVVQKFADSHPKLAENILKMPDGFERQKLVYENIKALGIDKPPKKEPSIQETVNAKMRSPFMPAPGHSGPGHQSQGDFSETGQKTAYNQLQELKKRLRI